MIRDTRYTHLRGVGDDIYESCACHVSAAHQCRTSLSYSLSIEFVCICNSPQAGSYRFRRRATPPGLHSSGEHTRGAAGEVVVPSSAHAPGMWVCCTAATGLGQWCTSSTKRSSAARCSPIIRPRLGTTINWRSFLTGITCKKNNW